MNLAIRKRDNMEGIERITKMLKGQKDKYLNVIAKHLMQHTELDQAFLNEEKNFKDMAEYIKGKAKKQATDGVAVIEDATVFKWARDYFIKSNKELGIKKTRLDRGKHGDVSKVEVKESEEFGSIFDSDEDNKEISTEDNKDKKEEIEQISLFGI